jgi:hypothetical protein
MSKEMEQRMDELARQLIEMDHWRKPVSPAPVLSVLLRFGVWNPIASYMTNGVCGGSNPNVMAITNKNPAQVVRHHEAAC